MSNRWVTAIILVLCSWALVEAQDVEDVIKVDVALVTVNVSVTDTKGRAFTGLQAVDFLVTDEDKPMRVEFFDKHGPVSIVFVVDLSSSMRGDKWRTLKAGIKKFLAKAHSGNDYTFIGFSDQPRVLARSVNEDELWQVINTVAPYGNTALYDAVLLGLNVLDQIPRRHKALVLFSDGEDTSSRSDLSEVRQRALTHRATIYTVGILREQPLYALPGGRTGKELLNELAVATGGLAQFPSSEEIQRVLKEIRADLTSRYSLSYYSAEKSHGWRRVQVRITPGPHRLKLRYQQRYLVR
jgi:Ca-activated chloride channel homolog